MCLVEDHVIPRLPLEDVLVLDGECIRGHAYVEGVLVEPALPELFPTPLIPVITKDAKSWQELLEFHLPIEEDTRWYDDEVWSPYASVTGKVCEQCDRLYGFP